MWLKAYLNFSPNHQPWAAVTDLLIDTAAPSDMNKEARRNPFLQCWNVLTQGPQLAKLNDNIRCMLKVARTYNTNLAVVKVSAWIQRELPAWYHIDNTPERIRSRVDKCLLNTHEIVTVTDLIKVSAHIRINPTDTYCPSPFCQCQDCSINQQKGCYDPHKCANAALTKLHRISPKLYPLGPENPQDNLSLTPNHRANNMHAKLSNEEIIFDPSLTYNTSLTDMFWVFIDLALHLTLPAIRHPQTG